MSAKVTRVLVLLNVWLAYLMHWYRLSYYIGSIISHWVLQMVFFPQRVRNLQRKLRRGVSVAAHVFLPVL